MTCSNAKQCGPRRRNETDLRDLGWRLMVIRECETKGQDAVVEAVIAYLGADIHSDGGRA